MKDTCDNFGNTGYESCSILLKGKAAVFSNSLEWTPYNYWLTGTRAQVVSSWGDYNPEDKNWILVANADSTYSDDDLDPLSGEFSYQIAAYQKKPDQETTMLRYFDAVSLSNEVLLIQPPKLYVPNAFTPNDDGINDLWNVRDVFVKDYNLKLFNKWGQLVFETQSKTQKWDGKMISGLYAPADVYVYTISYSGYDGSEHNQRGNVTVLK
jgi:gliding motility-associated-like protein